MFKRTACALALSLGVALSSPAHAGSTFSTQDNLSAVVAASVIVTLAPFVIVSVIAANADFSTSDRVSVDCRDPQGHTTRLDLPRAAVENAHLAPGDELHVVRDETGAMLTRNDQPVVYLVSSDAAHLSRNEEQTR